MIGTTANQKGEFLWRTLDSPIQIRVGDTAVVVGSQVIITRAGQVVEVRSLGAESVVPIESTRDETIDHVLYFKEQKMPGQNVSVVRVFENQSSGSVSFQFSSGTVTELPDWEAAGVIADEVDAIPDLAEKILIGKAFRGSPDGANKTNQVGASLGCNLLADIPIVYTEPQ
jgi:hypothetical protein